MLSDTYFYCQFMINYFIQYIKTSILQLPLLSLELEFLQPQLLQLPDPSLCEPVADGGGRVALPALGTLGNTGPAAGADEVLLGAAEDSRSGSWDLQANWALQVGLLLPDDFFLLLDT